MLAMVEQFAGFGGSEPAKSFNGLNADELVAENLVLPGGDLHQHRDGGSFLADANLIDHHGHDQGMRVGKNRGKDECSALRGRRVGGARQFADGQILKVPFPTGHRASQAAKQAVGIGGGEEFNGGADTLAPRFKETCFQERQSRNANRTQNASHGWQHLRPRGSRLEAR